MRILLIAIFGAVGTLCRYGLQGVIQTRSGSTFPHGTLIVNLTGCFFLGLLGQYTLNRMVISPEWRMAIAIGFFGGRQRCWKPASGYARRPMSLRA